ncbi:MAG: hypothetical protein ACLGHG_03210 [Gammaproteobacteria bacterium]
MTGILMRFVVLSLALMLVAGCQDPRGDGWQEVKALRAQVATLEKELDECRNGPDRQLRAARLALEKGEYALAISAARNLLRTHPRAAEVAEAQAIVDEAGKVLAAVEAERAAAATALAQQTEQQRAKAMSQMVRHTDDAQGVTYYRHRKAPEYLNARSALVPYVVVDRAGRVHLVMRNVYVARRALALESYTVVADDRVFEFRETFQQGSDAVSSWEWAEGAVTVGQREMLEAVSSAARAVIRYRGSAGTEERTIPPAEGKLIRDVLTAFDALAAAGQEAPAGSTD